MSRGDTTYQTRARALLLGIRPSIADSVVPSQRPQADNLSLIGIDSWRAALHMLLNDIGANADLAPSERWIGGWAERELKRDNVRWRDASSWLELLVLALTPMEGASEAHQPGRVFWSQWQQNTANLLEAMQGGSTVATGDTAELAEHCRMLIEAVEGPVQLADGMAIIASLGAEPDSDVRVFRPLATSIERLQLSSIIAASFDHGPVCVATESRLFENRPAPRPCRLPASWRTGGFRTSRMAPMRGR